MKAAPHHYLVAYTSPFSMALGVIAAITLLILGLLDEGALVADFGVLVWIVLAAIPAALIGLILGVIFIWGFLSHIAALFQGWPFKVGEEVVILTGKHKNTVAQIYEIWKERGQVRVDLGEELKESVKDVFGAVEVCRNKKRTANQALHGTADSRADASASVP
jgi:hypothetical protein